jgi:hypothetical protein
MKIFIFFFVIKILEASKKVQLIITVNHWVFDYSGTRKGMMLGSK